MSTLVYNLGQSQGERERFLRGIRDELEVVAATLRGTSTSVEALLPRLLERHDVATKELERDLKHAMKGIVVSVSRNVDQVTCWN